MNNDWPFTPFTPFYHLLGSTALPKTVPHNISTGACAGKPVREADLFGVDTDPTLVELGEGDLQKSLCVELDVFRCQVALQGLQQTQRENEVAEVSQFFFRLQSRRMRKYEKMKSKHVCMCNRVYRLKPGKQNSHEQPRFHRVPIISLLNAMVSVRNNVMILTGLLLASLAASEPQSEAPK